MMGLVHREERPSCPAAPGRDERECEQEKGQDGKQKPEREQTDSRRVPGPSGVPTAPSVREAQLWAPAKTNIVLALESA